VKTISTWNVVRKAGASWADGVHLDEDGYSTISRAVQEAAAELDLKRPASEAAGGPAKKKKVTKAQTSRCEPVNRGNPRGCGSIGGRGPARGQYQPPRFVEAGAEAKPGWEGLHTGATTSFFCKYAIFLSRY
jgi:hypothetical protein